MALDKILAVLRFITFVMEFVDPSVLQQEGCIDSSAKRFIVLQSAVNWTTGAEEFAARDGRDVCW
jgi:hypothetical protein